jgi:hypothetical protein
MTHVDLVPPPRRSDDAFTRSVHIDVLAARAAPAPWRVLVFALPTTAMAAAAVLFTVGGVGGVDGPVAVGPVDPGVLAGLVESEADAADGEFALDDVSDDDLVAFADVEPPTDQPGAFAFPDLDGSSEQDLSAVEAALDDAIRNL